MQVLEQSGAVSDFPKAAAADHVVADQSEVAAFPGHTRNPWCRYPACWSVMMWAVLSTAGRGFAGVDLLTWVNALARRAGHSPLSADRRPKSGVPLGNDKSV